MSIQIKMPALSPTMEEGTLAKWLVKEGDSVKSGDIMAEIETDKATMEFEAVDEGTIGKILIPEGTDNVKVGTVIATLNGEGEGAGAAPAGQRAGQGRKSRRERSDPGRARDRAGKGADRTRTAGREGPAPRTRGSRGHRAGEDDAARGAARCDGGGDACRRPRLRDGRGSRAISGRLQGYPGAARRVRRPAGDRYADHRIWLCRRRHGRGDGRTSGRSSSS